MKIHNLKIESKWLERIQLGEKMAELRLNDRDFQADDGIRFEGATELYKITHVLQGHEGLTPGWCILSIKLRS